MQQEVAVVHIEEPWRPLLLLTFLEPHEAPHKLCDGEDGNDKTDDNKHTKEDDPPDRVRLAARARRVRAVPEGAACADGVVCLGALVDLRKGVAALVGEDKAVLARLARAVHMSARRAGRRCRDTLDTRLVVHEEAIVAERAALISLCCAVGECSEGSADVGRRVEPERVVAQRASLRRAPPVVPLACSTVGFVPVEPVTANRTHGAVPDGHLVALHRLRRLLAGRPDELSFFPQERRLTWSRHVVH